MPNFPILRIRNLKLEIFILSLSLLFLTLLVILSCSPQLPTSIGRIREVVLVTEYHNLIDSIAKAILQDTLYTPQPEPEFLLRFEPLSRLEAIAGFHIILLVGTINDKPIQKLFGEHLTELEPDSGRLLSINEPWAKNQKVLLFITRNDSLLVSGFLRYSARIHWQLQQYVLDQMQRLTYQRGFNQRLKKKVLEKYGFAFNLPFGFQLVNKYELDKFIYFVTHNPDRSVFFYYEIGTKPLKKDDLLAFRDSLTAQFYEGDFVVKELCRADTVQFQFRSKTHSEAVRVLALRIKGVWQNKDLVAGGPFVSYCFNYQNRFYYLDGMVFNPGKYKLDNLNQLDVILQTFELE